MAKLQSQKKVGRAAFHANIFDGLVDPVILIDEKRVLVDANKAAYELLGDKVCGHVVNRVFDNPKIIKSIDGVLCGDPMQYGETHLPAPIGRTFEFSARYLPARTREKAGWVMLVLHDVTPTKMAEKMRVDFVANVSHELRSPLSTLSGLIGTLQGPARGDADAQDHFLSIMEQEAKRMTLLIKDLLTLSKVEACEYIPPDGEIDLKPVLAEVAKTVGFQAEKRAMSIVLKAKGSLPQVMGNKEELVQVFRNLLDNAINYGAQNSTIDIAAKAENATVAVSVTNRGEGIPAKYIPRLTERFYRIDKGRSRAGGGTGLGLAIVKHIVNRHRGRLEIASTPGETTTFTVHLIAKR